VPQSAKSVLRQKFQRQYITGNLAQQRKLKLFAHLQNKRSTINEDDDANNG